MASTRFYAPGDAYEGQYVARMNAFHHTGPSRILPVLRGDTVRASVFAFVKPELASKRRRHKGLFGLTALSGVFKSSSDRARSAPVPGLGVTVPIGAVGASVSTSSSSSGSLNWAFFNVDSVLIEQGSISLDQSEQGWQELVTEKTAKQAGYVLLYLQTSEGEVYFDNFKGSSSGRLLELHHYYPYGKEIKELSYENKKATADSPGHDPLPYGFASKRKLDWAGVPLQDFGARMYDSQLGRWNAIDPLSEAAPGWSPFRAFFDNPVRYADPTGMIEQGVKIYGMPDSPFAAAQASQGETKTDNKGNTSYSGYHAKEAFEQLQNGFDGGPPEGEDKTATGTVMPLAVTLAAVSGPLPVGVVVAAGVLAAALGKDLAQRVYVTYTLTNRFTGQIYAGRSSGYGDPYSIMMNRFKSHERLLMGYGEPVLDRFAHGLDGYYAIRGREQQLIDSNGGIGSPKVGNIIRGVSKMNMGGRGFHFLSNRYFGPLAPYTGY